MLSRDLGRDALVVLVWFVVLGVIAAVVWWQVTPLAEFTRTESNGQMSEAELGREVATDGWYFVIAAVGGLASGIALLALRRRDPLVMVVLVTLGSLLAAWLMLRVGLWLGPGDPKDALPHVAVGDTVPLQLEPISKGVPFIWPITALFGAVGVVWGLDERGLDRRIHEERVHDERGHDLGAASSAEDGSAGVHSG